ncbi:energy transducer TonB [Parerythrobacter jejuensis]|uniref:Energy transducer TonB n=1 Tax=Parerythrobacter jejuensis TaxID=795812 RepID=A0A845B230_9SPHN|nr:TonB C-terminal domain-containing protein [Parerythrobacter jejuensis]MXP30278.1 energy transducer TonB [Parerythrobacter jejuensis]MXP33038.1 energy transducer TonB [Parerythrobacter jejuensis]
MAAIALSREEGLGLGVAVALHVALVAVLLLQPESREAVEMPERVTVNLAEDVGLKAQAPQIVPESRAATAPELSDQPSPPPPEPQVAPQPPQPRATTAPRPRPTTRATPRPRATTAPRPRQTSAPRPRPTRAPAPPRASNLGDNFLDGAGSSTRTQETRIPASQIGASAKASLVQAIARKIKPEWQPPSGPEVEDIVTVLQFRLNEDGSLAGRPRVVRQRGINDVNRAQAGRHAEQAIRAVQLAAPFDLPPEYYNAWKNVSAFSFDWKLSQ